MTNFDHKHFLSNTPNKSGVYLMFNDKNQIIYVGKAKDLKKRLVSYFRSALNSRKTQSLVANIANIEITITNNELEALLLEQNYIKKYQPKYNVLLRDDKSYPYILLTKHRHPRLAFFRGIKENQGEYFGPYPNSSAVKETLSILKKIFPIRQCKDLEYKNRSRPCIEYQIGHCLAPCVNGLVTDEEYNQQVEFVRLFLQGKDEKVIQFLTKEMHKEAENLEFERAKNYRDKITAIKNVINKQSIESQKTDDLDIIAVDFKYGIACFLVMFVRLGKITGNRAFFPLIPENTELDEVITTFIGQFYLLAEERQGIPKQIILNKKLNNKNLLEQFLKAKAGHKVQIQNQSIKHAKFVKLAQMNAINALELKLQQQNTIQMRFQSLEKLLKIEKIHRIECFDISHTMGDETVASCVVFGVKGALRAEYRRFNIKNITPGDDYEAMEQALTKRFDKELIPEDIPDIILIDGGKGQLKRAVKVFQNLQVNWDTKKPFLIAVTKDENRKLGQETLIIHQWQKILKLENFDPALNLILQIRDEAHKHAITGHRAKRQKAITKSSLENIVGIGSKKRKALLEHFGGIQGIKTATIEDLEKVSGISKALAVNIFTTFNEQN